MTHQPITNYNSKCQTKGHCEAPETRRDEDRVRIKVVSLQTVNVGSLHFFLTNSNGFEMANEHGMGIRKTCLGTRRVLSGLNVTVTDGVAIRTVIISSLLPKLLFLSQFQISCLTVRLGVRGRVLRPQGQGDGLEKTVRKRQTIHSTDVYCAPIVYPLL